MLGFLSDGRGWSCCSFVKFRPGNASPQVGIEEAIIHTLLQIDVSILEIRDTLDIGLISISF
jgi:hypothetical protein